MRYQAALHPGPSPDYTARAPAASVAPKDIAAAKAAPRAKAVSLPDLDERLRAFTERASRVSSRLIALGNADAPSGAVVS